MLLRALKDKPFRRDLLALKSLPVKLRPEFHRECAKSSEVNGLEDHKTASSLAPQLVIHQF